jgi:adenosylcobinamide-GDP ribazoletransferase
MSYFFEAVKFLTVIPLGSKHDEKKPGPSLVYFPIVGVLLGAILAGASYILLSLGLSEPALSIITIILLIVFTGGIHLDGLSDTVDALAGGKDKNDILRIMRDPHAGVIGILAIVSVVLAKIAFLSAIWPTSKMAALILTCVIGRFILVYSLTFFPYAREDGKAKTFAKSASLRVFCLAAAITICIAYLAAGFKGLVILGAATGIAYLFNKDLAGKIDGITGDTLGAACELTELAVLFSVWISSTR